MQTLETLHMPVNEGMRLTQPRLLCVGLKHRLALEFQNVPFSSPRPRCFEPSGPAITTSICRSVSYYTVRADIWIYRWPDSTPGPNLTEGGEVVDS
jgi:hypothetical protein